MPAEATAAAGPQLVFTGTMTMRRFMQSFQGTAGTAMMEEAAKLCREILIKISSSFYCAAGNFFVYSVFAVSTVSFIQAFLRALSL